MPDLSIIIVSHNKPVLVKEAVQSVLNQTHSDWEAVLVDSGVLLEQGCFGFIQDPRFRVIPSGERPGNLPGKRTWLRGVSTGFSTRGW